MIEKLKVEIPQNEYMDLLDKCDDTLRSPGNEARHIIREHLKTKQTKPKSKNEKTAEKILITYYDQNCTEWSYVYSTHVPQIGDHVRMFISDYYDDVSLEEFYKTVCSHSSGNYRDENYVFNKHKWNDELGDNGTVFDGVVTKREWFYNINDFINLTDKDKESARLDELVVCITLG